MSRNFAQATLMDLSPSLLKKAEKLCHKLEELESKTVNIYPWLHRLGLEFISTWFFTALVPLTSVLYSDFAYSLCSSHANNRI